MKELRKVCVPSFEDKYFEVSCPKLDDSMQRRIVDAKPYGHPALKRESSLCSSQFKGLLRNPELFSVEEIAKRFGNNFLDHTVGEADVDTNLRRVNLARTGANTSSTLATSRQYTEAQPTTVGRSTSGLFQYSGMPFYLDGRGGAPSDHSGRYRGARPLGGLHVQTISNSTSVGRREDRSVVVVLLSGLGRRQEALLLRAGRYHFVRCISIAMGLRVRRYYGQRSLDRRESA
ncbi:hypothetical protein GHT06_017004 [Daphnia sinensis]|uniref:Uncharacterized protein n=1 Tax=Daphnia sinensis TaxID=1820382 RepID=A0AAD5PRW1_9CRUS|nr:hypothetical protein GHT06_017004 [Daphnia sinensis]